MQNSQARGGAFCHFQCQGSLVIYRLQCVNRLRDVDVTSLPFVRPISSAFPPCMRFQQNNSFGSSCCAFRKAASVGVVAHALRNSIFDGTPSALCLRCVVVFVTFVGWLKVTQHVGKSAFTLWSQVVICPREGQEQCPWSCWLSISGRAPTLGCRSYARACVQQPTKGVAMLAKQRVSPCFASSSHEYNPSGTRVGRSANVKAECRHSSSCVPVRSRIIISRNTNNLRFDID